MRGSRTRARRGGHTGRLTRRGEPAFRSQPRRLGCRRELPSKGRPCGGDPSPLPLEPAGGGGGGRAQPRAASPGRHFPKTVVAGMMVGTVVGMVAGMVVVIDGLASY